MEVTLVFDKADPFPSSFFLMSFLKSFQISRYSLCSFGMKDVCYFSSIWELASIELVLLNNSLVLELPCFIKVALGEGKAA